MHRVLAEQEARNTEKEKRVAAISATNLPPNALKDMIKAYNISRGHWRARKEACMEVVDVIRYDDKFYLYNFVIYYPRHVSCRKLLSNSLLYLQ
jgi:hypothetical protein